MRTIIIVLDSLGVGELSDSHLFGDEGSNTFLHIVDCCSPKLPNLANLGIYDLIGKKSGTYATFAKARELSMGKDTLTGHFELMGLIVTQPTKTYPHGFPIEIVNRLQSSFGVELLANEVGSGTELIKKYGRESEITRKPILYTSADSVLQLAAHVGAIPTDTLYKMCEKARVIMSGEYAVDRIIARPFAGEYPNYFRTEDRRDFSLPPPSDTLLNLMQNHGKDCIAVGKIEDIFAGSGITRSFHSKNNAEGIKSILSFLDMPFDGLLIANLVDFDMMYGHRNDVIGYAAALEYFDSYLPKIISKLQKGDLLVITADHGCDPTTKSTDHSREYVPMLFVGDVQQRGNLGEVDMSDLAATIAKRHGIAYNLAGKPLAL